MREAFYILNGPGSLQRVTKADYDDWFLKIGCNIKMEAPVYGGLLHSLKLWYDGKQDSADLTPFYLKYTEQRHEGSPKEVTRAFSSLAEASAEFLKYITMETSAYDRDILEEKDEDMPEQIIP
jgi:hypothetical protein